MKKSFSFLMTVLFIGCLFAASNLFAADANTTTKTIDLLKNATLDDFGFYLADQGKKEDVFSINNGILRITGTPFGWLETKENYKNFIIKADFRYPEVDKAVNSGIFLRINGTPAGFLPRTIEVQLQPKSNTNMFGFYDMKLAAPEDRFSIVENHPMFKVMRTVKRYQDAFCKDVTAWQTIEITCYEDFIMVRLNGRCVNCACQVENIPGKIGFQSEGGLIEFRNISITTEL